MLNEFHSNDRSSTCSNASKNPTRFDLPVGHEFASNILVADLAISATAYKPPSPPLPPTTNNDAVKSKRRVTFNLDDIQIQTIPAYDSTISATSSLDIIENDPILMSKSFEEEVNILQEEKPLYQEEQPLYQEPPPAPPISQPSTSERISKKASYDALQKRKQYRRDHQQPTIKPGYWYPLASTRTHMMRQSLPTMRTLEMTEKLINESIQREIALNPNLSYTPPSPSPSPQSDDSKLHNNSILISDSDSEEEQVEESDKVEQLIITTTTTASNTIISSDEEETHVSKTIEQEEQESDFSKSIFEELEKRHNSTDEFQFPFEQNLIPISASKNVLIISPPLSPPLLELHKEEEEEEPIWIDHPSLLINSSKSEELSGIFFINVLNTESLDFPINDDDTKAYFKVTFNNGNQSISKSQILDHSMAINHELRIQDIDPSEKISISIHVDENSKKRHHWYNRFKSTDLERYINEKDGSICHTSFLPNHFIVNGLYDQIATLMLVNNWYKPYNKKKYSTSIIREKAVGKIYIQCLYIMVPKYCKNIPQTMVEAIEDLNAKRFHQTEWQSGYLFQLGGNTKVIKKRYFTLIGGILFAYSDISKTNLLYKISLSRARKLVSDNNTIIVESSNNVTSPTLLLNQLDSISLQEEDNNSSNIENEFQIIFDNEESIHFSCESIEERSRWISVIEVMICKLPKLPEWIIS